MSETGNDASSAAEVASVSADVKAAPRRRLVGRKTAAAAANAHAAADQTARTALVAAGIQG